ncbi:MAG: archease [Candidatus Bipolaricaulota bacterium]
MSHSYLDHGADMGVSARAGTLEGVFQESAKGLFSLMADLKEVATGTSVEIKTHGRDREDLLYEWLSELLSLSNLRGEVYSEFADLTIEKSDTGYDLRGTVKGEKLDPGTHDLGTEVKAITYQGLDLSKEKNTWRCRFVVDV